MIEGKSNPSAAAMKVKIVTTKGGTKGRMKSLIGGREVVLASAIVVASLSTMAPILFPVAAYVDQQVAAGATSLTTTAV